MEKSIDPKERPGLSACVITHNEADRIADCIESVSWCDEVLVVDSHSTDRTREIAAAAGAQVIERDWPGYAAQKEFAVRSAANDWVLCVDADERVSPQLREELLSLRDRRFSGAVGWEMPRMAFYLGRWIRHGTWCPDFCLRLFDRRHGRWVSNPNYPLHEHVEVNGPKGRFAHHLFHYPYRTFSDHLRTIDHYTTIMAKGLYHAGKHATVLDLSVRPCAGFLHSYFLKRGFRDGWHGLLLAYLHAHYVRMKYAKLLILKRGAAIDQS